MWGLDWPNRNTTGTLDLSWQGRGHCPLARNETVRSSILIVSFTKPQLKH